MARATLRELDGLPLRDASRMPHPVDLGLWERLGYYYIDYDLLVFRLTEKGREKAREAVSK